MPIPAEKLLPLLHQQVTRLTIATQDQKKIIQFREAEIEELKALLKETQEALRLEEKRKAGDYDENDPE
jgi:hypothetical protein